MWCNLLLVDISLIKPEGEKNGSGIIKLIWLSETLFLEYIG